MQSGRLGGKAVRDGKLDHGKGNGPECQLRSVLNEFMTYFIKNKEGARVTFKWELR